ncbi:S-adenosyl-L-methionine-dependent methyltransferase [Pisolithus sp. B1]|nr:S-adenosyl-L-methionine-dependent methyltransferase [Pisolithus sp. B1]
MSNRVKLEALLALINSAAQQTMALYENVDATVPSIDSAEFHPLDEALDQVELKAAIRTLESACAQLCTTLAPPGHTAMNVRRLFSPDSHHEYPFTNILADYPKNIDVEPKKLSRIMRMLTTRGLATLKSPRPCMRIHWLSLALHSENSVSHMVNLHTESASLGPLYSYHPGHCPVMVANNKEGITEAFFNWMRQKFPFNKYSTVVDVGGGIDAFSLPLAKVHKHVKITVHDLPEALIQARSVWAKDCPEAIQENRVEFSELDFFTQVPVAGRDIYYLRNVIHDWPAPEPMLPNFGVGNIRMYEQDMIMFIMHNARERTLSELLELSDAAGLKLEKI